MGIVAELKERRVGDITISEAKAWSGTSAPGMLELRMIGGSYRDITPAQARELAYQLTRVAAEVEAQS